MTIGPAPMIRIGGDVGSFGHQVSRTGNWAQKKGAHAARPLSQEREVTLARGWSLDQIPHPRNPQKRAINGEFPASPLRATAWQARHLARASCGSFVRSRLACRAEAGGASEGWRPGLDLNQDKEHCTAPASTLPPPGRGNHRRSRRGEPRLPRLNPNPLGTAISDQGVPRHEGHPPRIVPDIELRARGGETGRARASRSFRLRCSAAGRPGCAIAGSPTARC